MTKKLTPEEKAECAERIEKTLTELSLLLTKHEIPHEFYTATTCAALKSILIEGSHQSRICVDNRWCVDPCGSYASMQLQIKVEYTGNKTRVWPETKEKRFKNLETVVDHVKYCFEANKKRKEEENKRHDKSMLLRKIVEDAENACNLTMSNGLIYATFNAPEAKVLHRLTPEMLRRMQDIWEGKN